MGILTLLFGKANNEIFKTNKKIFFVGNGSIAYKDMIESKMKNAEFLLDENKNKLNATNIGIVAYNKQQEAVDSNQLKPLYLRQSSAERK